MERRVGILKMKKKKDEIGWRTEKKGKIQLSKLSYCSVIPSMWKYHSIMFEWWMLHVLIMLFSSHSKESTERSSTAAGIRMWDRENWKAECVEKKMEERKKKEKIIYKTQSREFCSTEKCYLFLGEWKWKCQSERMRYTALLFSFSSLWVWLWFAFYFIYFTLLSSSMKMKWNSSRVVSCESCEASAIIAIAMLYVSREWRSWRWKGIKALFVITSTTCMMIYSYQRHDQNETFLFKKSNHENPWNVTKIQRVMRIENGICSAHKVYSLFSRILKIFF